MCDAAVGALADGIWVTLKTFPFLAGTVGPADPETGRISLRYPRKLPPDALNAGLFAYSKLSYPDEFDKTYAELKKAGMPMEALRPEAVCPHFLRNYPGVPPLGEGLTRPFDRPVPVSATQAIFIPGGLLLSIYIHHSVVDCAGLNNFWRHLALNVRERTCPHFPALRTPLPDQSNLRMKLDQSIPRVDSPTADAFTMEKFTYEHTLPDNTPCSVRLFLIPAAKIRAYREKLKEGLNPDIKLTICNVLAALIWIHITRARAARLLAAGCVETSNGIAVDTRRRLDPPMHEEYMGALALFTKATLPISHFLAEDRITDKTILSTALEINRVIRLCENDWVLRHLAFFKAKTPIADTEPAIKFRFGPDIYITSWMNFGADHKWNIPGTTMEQPEFIRRPTNPSDGGIIILPRRRALVDGKEAPYEIMIRLATEDMQRLESEEGGLSSWAERIV